MKTWALMYSLIWASFFQIFLIVFLLSVIPSSGFQYDLTIDLHVAIGIAVIFLAITAYRFVKETKCPDRIKRISKTTAILGGVQGLLGVILFALMHFNVSMNIVNFVLLLHVVNALAIIAQASSSATAFDMWEEKEFEPPASVKPA
jgi:multisubunit Na+/H+ antiporter MnhF subunit